MSSTNKTSKIQLNQWVSTDPVLREDFNLDNEKIDAAFQSVDSSIGTVNSSIAALGASLLAQPYVKLKEISFSAPVQLLEIDLGVDIWSFRKLLISAALLGNRLSDSGVTRAYLSIHGVTGAVYGDAGSMSGGNTEAKYTWLARPTVAYDNPSSGAPAVTSEIEFLISGESFMRERMIAAYSRANWRYNTRAYQQNHECCIYTTTSANSLSVLDLKGPADGSFLNGRISIFGIK